VNNNKVIAIVVGAVAALLALSFVVRFVLLSQYGFSGGWIFFALPFGGIGVLVLLLRLGVNGAVGRSSGTGLPSHYNIGVQARPPRPRRPHPRFPNACRSLRACVPAVQSLNRSTPPSVSRFFRPSDTCCCAEHFRTRRARSIRRQSQEGRHESHF
jgi:hypothetical protein